MQYVHQKEKNITTNFCRLFKEATGKEFSSSMVRKCFISDEINDKNIDVKSRKEIASKMGHSCSMQAVRYSKFSKMLHTDDDDLESLIEQRRLLNKLQKDLDQKILNKLKLIE